MAKKMGQMSPIHFYFENVDLNLRNRKKLKAFINRLIIKENRQLAGLSYIFSSDKALFEINRKYLKHNFYTDVITFDLSTSSKEILADIYISADRVKENAQTLKLSFKEELHRVMFHGLLHLCGYNDKTDNQRRVMRSRENFYLDLYFHSFHVKH